MLYDYLQVVDYIYELDASMLLPTLPVQCFVETFPPRSIFDEFWVEFVDVGANPRGPERVDYM